MSTKIVDKGWKRIWKDVEALDKQTLVVGVLGGLPYASYHEFGTTSSKGNQHIPPRPFMRMTFEEKSDLMQKAIAASWVRIIGGSSATAEANKLGNFYRSEIQKTIRNGKFTPLAAVTVKYKKKKSTKPLIDTGRMIGAIAYELR